MASIHPGYDLGPRDAGSNTGDDPTRRAPLVLGGLGFRDVTDRVSRVAVSWPAIWWWVLFVPAVGLAGLFFGLIGYLVTTGVGVWGNNQPNAWGFPIINFVFWVGIGHAGTLISAILFLFRQNWRTSINRFAEAMTIFAVVCAGIFPAIHVGRPWLAYWLFPYPNQMAMWPQFRSPLLWDVFAVSTYASVSLLFWYTGMVPDIATLRDRTKNRIAKIGYGIASLGWTGSSRHWSRFEKAYLLLAALCTPLVLSVHSVVSFDFAVAQLPGWHTTIFPPYFVAGAIFGGFAMVLTLAIPARYLLGFKDIITERHIDNCAKVMLGTGMIVAFAYTTEFFYAWYSGHHYEKAIFLFRPFGPYAWAFWTMFLCNICAPQLMWVKRFRLNPWIVMISAMGVNIGMWFERFVITITSLSNDFLPSSWALFEATWVDGLMFTASFGLFFTNFLLFLKFLPTVAISEVKTVMPAAHASHH
ncbi:NrfD/PsrC family molybdoenzyme membrane anchor subunit [Phycisphaera mikurensis]|uniref:Polysulphide reductase NrfD family protein n=1 Tax=Phycisphaera mikurensis (strain NBRC 102666 / KCTC 22515 / FYK2301M01) TaxID=1142394 RepID=I0ICC1_PHYMF|nr:NrfD/PsrC family molybdoenzyme membrane anchor subunit [Phycisphaera mikurensis]MBB6442214.1 molybdopterin-containing oxidoreductase family membrane subunit [Phycisphaera mikurensis]BAM02909.1 polysulphide reductase NrfD family protein [Phycisphaera mikurensis NBRC 102666]